MVFSAVLMGSTVSVAVITDLPDGGVTAAHVQDSEQTMTGSFHTGHTGSRLGTIVLAVLLTIICVVAVVLVIVYLRSRRQYGKQRKRM
jgi:uncharacterized membrane protein